MSERHAEFDLREQLARIDNMAAETRQLFAEHDKLFAEERKLMAERDQPTAATIKSYAETAKIHRDRWLAPLLAIGAFFGSLIGAGSAIYRLILG
jgi:uncharacterized protein (DUF3084 family)